MRTTILVTRSDVHHVPRCAVLGYAHVEGFKSQDGLLVSLLGGNRDGIFVMSTALTPLHFERTTHLHLSLPAYWPFSFKL